MPIFAAADALEMAVQVEENGTAFYEAAAKGTKDVRLKELFEELARREQAHRKVFEDLARRVEPASKPSNSDVGDYGSFLEAALDHAIFSGPEKALRLAEEASDRDAALRAAMAFEKDTMLFYYDLREMVGERDREIISDIIREEKRHLSRLVKLV